MSFTTMFKWYLLGGMLLVGLSGAQWVSAQGYIEMSATDPGKGGATCKLELKSPYSHTKDFKELGCTAKVEFIRFVEVESGAVFEFSSMPGCGVAKYGMNLPTEWFTLQTVEDEVTSDWFTWDELIENYEPLESNKIAPGLHMIGKGISKSIKLPPSSGCVQYMRL